MAGTIRGRIDCLINDLQGNRNATVIWSHIYGLVATIPGVKIEALGYGSGGTGTDPWDGANPIGTGGFFVARWAQATLGNDYYMMVVVGTTPAGGGVPSPAILLGGGTLSSSTSICQVGIQVAVGIGGVDPNPFNTTKNADGTDTYSTPIMTTPSGGSNVLGAPRSNFVAGADETLRNNFAEIANVFSTSAARFSVVVDDDSIMTAFDATDSGVLNHMMWAGRFVKNPAIDSAGSGYDHPLALASVLSSPNFSTALGDDNGAVISPNTGKATQQSARLLLTLPGGAGVLNTDIFPDSEAGGIYSIFPVDIYAALNAAGGYRGRSDFLHASFNIPTYDTTQDRNFISLGSATNNDEKIMMPWDGTTAPQSTATRAGVSFTR